MRLTVGQLRNVLSEADEAEDLVLEVHREIMEAMQSEAGQENVRTHGYIGASGNNINDGMIIVNSKVPSIPEAAETIKSIMWMLCGEEPKYYTRPEPSKWHNKIISLSTKQVNVKVELYRYTGEGEFDVLVWEGDSVVKMFDKPVRETVHETNDVLDDVYMELFEFISLNSKIFKTEEGGALGKVIWAERSDTFSTKTVADQAHKIVESLTGQVPHLAMSGRQGPRSYTVITKEVKVRIDVVPYVDDETFDVNWPLRISVIDKW